MQAVETKAPVLREPPAHLRAAFAATKGALLRRALDTIANGQAEEVEQAWFQILLFDKLVCHTGGGRQHGGLNAKLRHRLRAVDEGDWLDLLWELLDVQAEEAPTSSKDASARVAERVTRMAKAGSWRRALGCVMAEGGVAIGSADTWRKLLA